MRFRKVLAYYCCQETFSEISGVKFAGNLTILDLFVCAIVRQKWREKNTWAKLSCTVGVVYHFCMENHLSKILFSNPFPKKL